MAINIYMELTQRFNSESICAILAGGQAAVLHSIAFMSKDGDWIIREQTESIRHILKVLSECGASYRFGAPLDVRWLAAGWSSHLEFQHDGMRIRTDFVTRPPRINERKLERIWQEVAPSSSSVPYVNADQLAEMKKTNREKDYVVIGELARRMSCPKDQLLYSRSARDLLALSTQYPDYVDELCAKRPLLVQIEKGREVLEEALDAERRQFIRKNEERLMTYLTAAQPWQAGWPELVRQLRTLPLIEAHNLMVERAENVLPVHVPGGWP